MAENQRWPLSLLAITVGGKGMKNKIWNWLKKTKDKSSRGELNKKMVFIPLI